MNMIYCTAALPAAKDTVQYSINDTSQIHIHNIFTHEFTQRTMSEGKHTLVYLYKTSTISS